MLRDARFLALFVPLAAAVLTLYMFVVTTVTEGPIELTAALLLRGYFVSLIVVPVLLLLFHPFADLKRYRYPELVAVAAACGVAVLSTYLPLQALFFASSIPPENHPPLLGRLVPFALVGAALGMMARRAAARAQAAVAKEAAEPVHVPAE